jgi:hypothetical protein
MLLSKINEVEVSRNMGADVHVFVTVLYLSVTQPPSRGPVPGPGINYTWPSFYRKKNLPGRGLTKVENHCSI